ncbi:hypothetical protein ABI59_03470 [Acidobacteria bacterium Mor1]|nr:hypothetical protein ABI59_03470 [Acidobacteria bacterium Mor1]
MNVHDSEKLAGSLHAEGYTKAESAEDADVILLNTCSIREKAAEKMFSDLGRIRAIKNRRPELLIGVCGCVAQQEGEAIFRRAPYVDFVMGPRSTGSLPETVRRLRGETVRKRTVDTEYRRDSIEFPFDRIRREGPHSAKAFVTIIEGCNHRCTYCIVPTTRGREVYRPMDQVLAEVRSLAERGTYEIEFLGQTVNAYRDPEGNTLAELLHAASEVEGIRRLRFTTSHPAQMTDAIMDAMAACRPIVCPYLHLPVQSGSTEVLKAMRRGYTRERYLEKIEALRARIPQITFGTDIIVGFPTETEEDFQQTLSLLREVEYDSCYSFAYSPRPGTASLELVDNVPQEEKAERLARLQALQKSIQERRQRRWIGREVEVLVEGPSKTNAERWTGRTPENRVVIFDGETAPGRLERLEIVESTPFSLRGRQVTPVS